MMIFSILVAALVSLGANVLANPGFEKGADGWRTEGEGWKSVPGVGVGGSKALVWKSQRPTAKAAVAQGGVRIEPGAVYRLKARVRKDRLTGGSVRVAANWWGTDDRARPASSSIWARAGETADGWTLYEGVTEPMPEKVDNVLVTVSCLDGAVGEVRVDDVSLVKEAVDPIVFFESSAYRNSAVEGEVRFLAGVHAAGRKLTGEIAFKGTKGKMSRKGEWPDASSVLFKADVRDFPVGETTVTLTLKAGREVVAERELVFTREDQPTKRRVTVDASHRLVVDGKRFFPLGMYAHPTTEEEVRKYKEGQFNCVSSSFFARDPALDLLADNGIYVVSSVRRLLSGDNPRGHFNNPPLTVEQSHEALKGVVDRIGGHRALLAWELADEEPGDYLPHIVEANRYLRKIDRDHPTIGVINRPRDVKWFFAGFDIAATDLYPIGMSFKTSDVTNWIRTERMVTQGFKPLWQVPQACNWAWYLPPGGLVDPHMPTRAEFGSLAWQSIAAGANGLLFYSYSDMVKRLEGPDFDRAWADLCAVTAEIKRMEVVLLGEDAPGIVGGFAPEELSVRAFSARGKDWVLAVNLTEKPLKRKVRLNGRYSMCRVAVGETATMDGNYLTVDLKPIGYVFVGLKK